MTLRALALAAMLPGLSLAAEPVRLLVAIANASGAEGDEPLRYAAADAEHFRSLMIEIGQVSESRSYLLIDRSVIEVQRTLSVVAGRLTELKAAGRDTMLLVYVSSHAKDRQLHLGATALPLEWWPDFAVHSDAQVALVIVDACESGSLTRYKGGTGVPEYALELTQQPMSGRIFLSASGPVEPAQEWDSLGGSLFTHHLLTGLRGDADLNHDGAVSLAEAYTYAYQRTVANARGTGQHPVLDIDLAGSGELHLTQPGGARTAVELPAQSAGHYLLVSQPRPEVVAEFDKTPGAPLRIAIPPGRYVVRKTLVGAVGLQSIELRFGGVVVLDDSRLERRAVSEARMKGGAVELHPSAVFVEARYLNQQLEGTGGRWLIGLGLRHTWSEWWASLGLGVGTTVFRGPALWVDEFAGRATAQGGYRWLSTSVSLFFGALTRLSLLRQQVTRDDELRIRAIAPALSPSWVLGADFGASVGVELTVWGPLFTMATIEAVARFLPSASQPPWTAGLSGGALVGFRF